MQAKGCVRFYLTTLMRGSDGKCVCILPPAQPSPFLLQAIDSNRSWFSLGRIFDELKLIDREETRRLDD